MYILTYVDLAHSGSIHPILQRCIHLLSRCSTPSVICTDRATLSTLLSEPQTNILYESIEDHSAEAGDLLSLYQACLDSNRFTSNSISVEKLCLQRWFAVSSIASKYNLSRFACIDWDLLLNIDLFNMIHQYYNDHHLIAHFAEGLRHSRSSAQYPLYCVTPSFIYLSHDALRTYLNYQFKIVSSILKEKFKKFTALDNYHDMWAWSAVRSFYDTHFPSTTLDCEEIGDVFNIHIDNLFWDSTQGMHIYEMTTHKEYGVNSKSIIRHNGDYCVCLLDQDRSLRKVATLHMQGMPGKLLANHFLF